MLATVLPMAWPAMTRPDGRVFIGLAAARELRRRLPRPRRRADLNALQTPPGQTVGGARAARPGPAAAGRHRERRPARGRPCTRASTSGSTPTRPTTRTSRRRWSARTRRSSRPQRLAAAPAAYWCRVPDKSHVRWVLPDDEDPALDALARLAAGGEIRLGDDTRFAGMFRAHGLLVPVWDPAHGTEASAGRELFAAVVQRYAEALSDEPLYRRRAPRQAGSTRKTTQSAVRTGIHPLIHEWKTIHPSICYRCSIERARTVRDT